MSAKVHIFDSDLPYNYSGGWVATRCNETIQKPQIVFMWDLQEMGAEMNVSGCCRKCLKVEDPRMRYSYGVKV